MSLYRGPNGTLREAFTDGLMSDHDAWRQMAKDRTLMSHTYDRRDARSDISGTYLYLPTRHCCKETQRDAGFTSNNSLSN